MKLEKISFWLVVSLVIYWAFEVYIGWLVIAFPVEQTLAYLYVSMVAINIFGIYVYHLIGTDFLGIQTAKQWMENENGKCLALKNIFRRSRPLSFIALSILPCPMAGYYLVVKEKRTFPKVATIIGLGSIPCALVWGGGLTIVWQICLLIYSQYISNMF